MATETEDVDSMLTTMMVQLVSSATRAYPPAIEEVMHAICYNYRLVQRSPGIDAQAAVCEISEVLNSSLDTQTKVKRLEALNKRIVLNDSKVKTQATLAFRWIRWLVRKTLLYPTSTLLLFISRYCDLVIEVFTFSTSKLPELAILVTDKRYGLLKDNILYALSQNQVLVRTIQNYRNSSNIYLALCSAMYQALTQARLSQTQVYDMFFDMVDKTSIPIPSNPGVLSWVSELIFSFINNNVQNIKGGPVVEQTATSLEALIKNVNSQEEHTLSVLYFTLVVLFVLVVLKVLEYLVQKQANHVRTAKRT